MTKDEALKLALSALNEVRQETFQLMKDSQTLYSEKKMWEAIYTIKKVLAQPKEREWVGLTPTDWFEALKDIDPETKRLPQGFSLFASAIEAKLKKRNT